MDTMSLSSRSTDPCDNVPLYGKIVPEGDDYSDSNFYGPVVVFDKGVTWDCVYQPHEHCLYRRVFDPSTSQVQYIPCEEEFGNGSRFVIIDSNTFHSIKIRSCQ